MPEEVILNSFRDFLVMAAKTDRSEYWSVAEQVYRALQIESKACTECIISLHTSEQDQTYEDTETAVFLALEIVNHLSEAAEAWWHCFDRDLQIARNCTRQRKEAFEWFTPLLQSAEEHYNRVQALHQRAFHEILTFARVHGVVLRIPLEQPLSERCLHQLRDSQREQQEEALTAILKDQEKEP